MKFSLSNTNVKVGFSIESLDVDNLTRACTVISNMSDEDVENRLLKISSRGCPSPTAVIGDIQFHHALFGYFESKIKPIMEAFLKLPPIEFANVMYGDSANAKKFSELTKKLWDLWTSKLTESRDNCPALKTLGLNGYIPSNFEDLAKKVVSTPDGETLGSIGWKKVLFSTLTEVTKYFYIGDDNLPRGLGAKQSADFTKYWDSYNQRCRPLFIAASKEFDKMDGETIRTEQQILDGMDGEPSENGLYIQELFVNYKHPVNLLRWSVSDVLEGKKGPGTNIMFWDLSTLVEKIIAEVL